MIKIRDLCQRLNENKEEKMLFFKNLKDPKFLDPFFKNGILDFNDESASLIVNYLKIVLNQETKTVIVDVVNSNSENFEILPYHVFWQLVELLSRKELEEDFEEKIEYSNMFKNPNSVCFCHELLKKDFILNTKNLYRDCINNLLEYKLEKEYGNRFIAVTIHEGYQFGEVFRDEVSKKILSEILKNPEIYVLLLNKYEEIHNKIYPEIKNPHIEVYSRQSIEQKNDNNLEHYKERYIIDLIINLLTAYLIDGYDETEKLQALINSEYYMLRKLALYVILKRKDKYSNLFIKFIENLPKEEKCIEEKTETELELILFFCAYEIIDILEDFDFNSDDIKKLKEFINKIVNKKTKYRILYGLKKKEDFKKDFEELKGELKYELYEPKLYIKSGIGGFVKPKSPISKEYLGLKSIEEQIDYLNSDIKYSSQLIQIDKNSVEEENQRGLLSVFQDLVKENINLYLSNENTKRLSNIYFISGLVKLFEKHIIEIDIKKCIEFIQNAIDKHLHSGGESYEFYYNLIKFNEAVILKKPEFIGDIKPFIKHIRDISSTINDNEFENIDDIALNTLYGRNWYCYFLIIQKEKTLNEECLRMFFDFSTKKDVVKEDAPFYYYLGWFFDNLFEIFKEKGIVDLIKKLQLNSEPRCHFLFGYLSSQLSLNTFAELKDLIYEDFQNDTLEKRARERIIRVLTVTKVSGKDKLNFFEIFKEVFTEVDFIQSISALNFENIDCSKNDIIDYWQDLLNNHLDKDISAGLLGIFNKYFELEDFVPQRQNLGKILNNLTNSKKELNRELNVLRFLKKLLNFTQQKQDNAGYIIYDLMNILIKVVAKIQYKHESPKILTEIIEILNEYSPKNAANLARQFRETEGLIIFSDLLSI